MTLAEFQPHVERAVTALEWTIARARRLKGLLEERANILGALPVAEIYSLEREPMESRLAQIERELQQDVTEDCVSPSPLRSVPMDLITAAVVRRILRVPAEFPILGVKIVPSHEDIAAAVEAIATRWRTPTGQMTEA